MKKNCEQFSFIMSPFNTFIVSSEFMAQTNAENSRQIGLNERASMKRISVRNLLVTNRIGFKF